MRSELSEAQEILEGQGYKVEAPPAPRPVKPTERCAFCKVREDEAEGGLTDISVEVAYDQTGHSLVEKLACATCLNKLVKVLANLGIKSHRHGGVNYLEDTRCPGFRYPERCPHKDMAE